MSKEFSWPMSKSPSSGDFWENITFPQQIISGFLGPTVSTTNLVDLYSISFGNSWTLSIPHASGLTDPNEKALLFRRPAGHGSLQKAFEGERAKQSPPLVY